MTINSSSQLVGSGSNERHPTYDPATDDRALDVGRGFNATLGACKDGAHWQGALALFHAMPDTLAPEVGSRFGGWEAPRKSEGKMGHSLVVPFVFGKCIAFLDGLDEHTIWWIGSPVWQVQA